MVNQHFFSHENTCEANECQTKCRPKTCRILYATQTGTSRQLSLQLDSFLRHTLSQDIDHKKMTISLNAINEYEPEDSLVSDANNNAIIIIVMSTYSSGSPPSDGKWFCQWLQDFSNDFRVDKSSLKGLSFAIFGVGDKAYGQHFCRISQDMDRWLKQLEATPIVSTQLSDISDSSGFDKQFKQWMNELSLKLSNNSLTESKTYSEDTKEDVEEDEPNDNRTKIVDIEDIVNKSSKEKMSSNGIIKDMITPELRKELTKQGYRLIGSHSGVKLCRWTKSMLRGRGLQCLGGCYKHSFYGIESHRCMETTPSLACANKCVFCWRHHTNPVGTEWKWSLDDPELVFAGALSNHYQMINEFKGVPGVQTQRLNEAMKVRHCALSLVGEPIMYPHINSFVRMLHNKQISTFLVTNAQFPDAIKQLDPVTQLYVSVDASSKQSLKRIDRPLFRDFWERFTDTKGQRTVYRLTLVKSWNVEELEGYAYLVGLGNPDFIEIKGVTYCGTGKDTQLTMANVPFHEEVLNFSRDLLKHLNSSCESEGNVKYGLSCEHKHSNCVLIASTKFLIDNRWHTWIDYDMFARLIDEYYRSEGTKTFSSLDYIALTPEWALVGSDERGFDPNDTRFYRNRKNAAQLECCQPLKMNSTLNTIDEQIICELNSDINSNTNRIDQKAFKDVHKNVIYKVVPPMANDSTNGNGFIVIEESDGSSPPTPVSSGSDHKITDGFGFTSTQKLSQEMRRLRQLFDILSDQSDVDHPLCEECADFVIDQMDHQLRQLEDESKEYNDYLNLIQSEQSVDPNVNESEICELTERFKSLETIEKQLTQELNEVKEQQKKANEDIDKQSHELKRLYEEEDKYWHEYNNIRHQIFICEDEQQSVDNQLRYAQNLFDKLKRTNVFNATFHIWHSGPFGTINNFRLGRLPTVPVEWGEINAAWVPYGNHSFLESLEDRSRELPLYASGGIRYFWNNKFDNAMVAFLDCLTQFKQHIQTQDSEFVLPYKMEKETIEETNIGAKYSIKIQFNTEEQWTKALKFMLTNLKWALAWVSAQFLNNQSVPRPQQSRSHPSVAILLLQTRPFVPNDPVCVLGSQKSGVSSE
ncbi:unnamed protein product [Medioppia subpectinata]|uniref:tRNA 4-demethylwyosine synthase (AdoMet-dependent) n=1 Tax=Medioppia subpectinata TaxID=1979941 RepID=A0A7R9PW48_9ACAR|nr:unnamed protein product [Medioppia subpectinata]CAG2103548.1 unnamed protein product [Medioppia subpectinata]